LDEGTAQGDTWHLLGLDPIWIPVVIAVILLLIVALVVIAVVGFGADIDLGWGDRRVKAAKPRSHNREMLKYQGALLLLDDLSQAMVAVTSSRSSPGVDRRAREWFDHFSSSLGHALALGGAEWFRVTVWLDDDKNQELRAIGHHLTRTSRLPHAPGILAAHVIDQESEYYCKDTSNDAIYRSPGRATA
jgi:hypothetical protein